MSEEPNEEVNEIAARVGSEIRFSRVWLVPVVALFIGIWMTYAHFAGLGQIIEITFVSGEGIQAGTTKVRRKNVEVGEVLDLRLSEDSEAVVLSVRIYPHAGHLLREDSRFWVVRPRIGAGGVSGLSTLLSGAYIELSPGSEDDSAQRFEGLEKPPVTPRGTPGLHVTLDSAGSRPLHEGDPILFHGIEVGKIELVYFNNEKRRTYYDAFIAAPYDHLVTDRTRFWFSSGLSVNLSADGIRFEMASLASVLAGGVSFDVPEGQPLGEFITERAYFSIYENEAASHEIRYENALSFIILFDDSIRGLKPGAPVEYRGVKVGEVVRTDIDYPDRGNLLEPDSKIPVQIDVVPARLGFSDDYAVLSEVDNQIHGLIESGLRAELATGNLLTGRKYVELRYHDDSVSELQTFAGYTVIPSMGGNLDQLLASASLTLETINRLPLGQVLDSANNALEAGTVALDGVRKLVAELDQVLADPASHELASTLNETLMSFQKVVIDLSEGSATNEGLRRSLKSLEQTLNELEPVLRNLRRRPNSLIFGGSEEQDLEPTGVPK